MKKFVLLHYGYMTPTPAIMDAWNQWFTSIKDSLVDMGTPFATGREISKSGTKELPLGLDSITGFTIISADNLDEAEKIAKSCPSISSVRVYETREM